MISPETASNRPTSVGLTAAIGACGQALRRFGSSCGNRSRHDEGVWPSFAERASPNDIQTVGSIFEDAGEIPTHEEGQVIMASAAASRKIRHCAEAREAIADRFEDSWSISR